MVMTTCLTMEQQATLDVFLAAKGCTRIID